MNIVWENRWCFCIHPPNEWPHSCYLSKQAIHLQDYINIELFLFWPLKDGVRGRRMHSLRHVLVGLRVGSLLATRDHWPRGITCCMYAIVAKHCASMEGKPNDGPQICSSRTMIDIMRKVCAGFCAKYEVYSGVVRFASKICGLKYWLFEVWAKDPGSKDDEIEDWTWLKSARRPKGPVMPYAFPCQILQLRWADASNLICIKLYMCIHAYIVNGEGKADTLGSGVVVDAVVDVAVDVNVWLVQKDWSIDNEFPSIVAKPSFSPEENYPCPRDMILSPHALPMLSPFLSYSAMSNHHTTKHITTKTNRCIQLTADRDICLLSSSHSIQHTDVRRKQPPRKHNINVASVSPCCCATATQGRMSKTNSCFNLSTTSLVPISCLSATYLPPGRQYCVSHLNPSNLNPHHRVLACHYRTQYCYIRRYQDFFPSSS